jgi:hypothetical protein
MTRKFQSFRRFDWYGQQILVWPIAALPNDLSANQKGVFSVTCDAAGTGINREPRTLNPES